MYEYPEWARLEVMPLVPSQVSSLLDVGCGVGGFSRSVKSAYPQCRVVGIDINSEAAAAAELIADHVIVGSVTDAFDHLDETFECVAFLDVLEHLVDPWECLKAARSLLQPGGVVVISIPNVRCLSVSLPLLVKGEWTYQGAGILDRTHLRFFTRETALAMVKDAGFEIVRVEPLSRLGGRGGIKRLGGRTLGRLAPDLITIQYGIVARPI